MISADQAKNTSYLERVTHVKPGGNDTAIVWDDVKRVDQPEVARVIQELYPEIEQVMFAEAQADDSIYGQMAGGEFCGNATRSLGFLLLDNKPGTIILGVSGAERPVTVTVDSNGFSKTSIPVKCELAAVRLEDSQSASVFMEGIAFKVVASEDDKLRKEIDGSNVDERRANILKILTDAGLMDQPAAGVMVFEQDRYLHPYVYVKSTGSLYYETGCGSGSTAVALVETIRTETSVVRRELVQPSGMSLYVTVNRTANKIIDATVEGPVTIVSDGPLSLGGR